MSRKVDRRDFTIDRASLVRRNMLTGVASEVSDALPGEHRVRITRFDPMTGNPAVILSESAPSIKGNYIQRALDHVNSIRYVLGLAQTQAAEFIASRSTFGETSSGALGVHLRQMYKGIPILGAATLVHFAPDGRLKRTSGRSVTIESEILVSPQISAQEAIKRGVLHVSEPDEEGGRDIGGRPFSLRGIDISGFSPNILETSPTRPDRRTLFKAAPFEDIIKACLIWFPQGDELRLAWEVIITLPDHQGQFCTFVDAQNGDILYCHQMNRTAVGQGNIYRVNGASVRRTTNFPRSLSKYPLPMPSDLPAGFPDDWVTQDQTEGNNVRAIFDEDGPAFRGEVSQDGELTFNPADPSGEDQQVLNAFYWCNYMHDYFYLLGFREGDGNFQVNNYDRGGEKGQEGDPVNIIVFPQEINGMAMMKMNEHVDGKSPTLMLGLVNHSNRHTALDSDIVFHEYTHGVTERLVGGGIDYCLSAFASWAMSEGWSDYFPCTINRKTVHGDWTHDTPGGNRPYPYDIDFPDSFADLGTAKNGVDYAEEHNAGAIWCATLMEMNRNIGANLGVQLVFDALKLTCDNPTFIQGRDAILEALRDKFEANQLSVYDYHVAWHGIWGAFVKFGMGPGALGQLSANGNIADFNFLAVRSVATIWAGKSLPISVMQDILKSSHNQSLKMGLEEFLQTHGG